MHLPPEAIEEMVEGMRRVLTSSWLILGPETEEFERWASTATGAPHAVAVSTGTAALEIALRSLDVAGHSVVVPANTFFATAEAVIRAGGVPVLAEVGEDMLLDARSIDAAWRDDTCGVVVVHLGGMITGAMAEVVEMASSRSGFVLEDSAQGLGSACPLGRAGSIGVAAGTSFYPTKIVTAGEGGILSTADEDVAAKARIYRDQGKASFGRNDHVLSGYSWRLSELHAVVGRVHGELLADVIEQRRRVAAVYDDELAGSEVHVVREPDGHRWNRYKYVAILPDDVAREQVRAHLAADGIGLSGEVFATPLHHQPVFRGLFGTGGWPEAERVCAQHICLPISPDITDEEAVLVARTVRKAVDLARKTR